MPALRTILDEKIADMRQQHRLRVPDTCARTGEEAGITFDAKPYISFSCNDYFGLLHHPNVIGASSQALEKFGVGGGASRALTGNHPLYDELEVKLAAYKGTEAACIFGSGYLANIGTIPALMGKGDVIFADKLVHACMLDGVRLSDAKLIRFKHNDMEDLAQKLEMQRGQYRHALIATETVFSMDGDLAPLPDIIKLAKHHNAWTMTDDAHGLGFLNSHSADVQMGTLSKGLASYGGYVCGSRELVTWLKASARSLIFSTALPPASIAAASAALDVLQSTPDRVALPLARAQQFTRGLKLPLARSPIVPLMLGSENRALQAADEIKGAGFLALPIRPPTVAVGTSRLRFAFSALHSEGQVEALIACIQARPWFEGGCP